MVSVHLKTRLKHFVPLHLLKAISSADNSIELECLTPQMREDISNMTLLGKGRLSVQPVEEGAWNAICTLGEKGGWEEMKFGGKKRKSVVDTENKKKPTRGLKRKSVKRKVTDEADDASSPLSELS